MKEIWVTLQGDIGQYAQWQHLLKLGNTCTSLELIQTTPPTDTALDTGCTTMYTTSLSGGERLPGTLLFY